MDVTALAQQLLEREPPGHALDIAQAHLEDHDFHIDRRTGDLPALTARRGQDGCVLSGHVDVVPVGDDWTHPPFGNHVEKRRLYGRGASDMRGPVAAMLTAVATTDAPATVVLTCDEETTMHTARALVREGVVDGAPLVVVGEPTGLDVATSGKGVAWMELTVEAPAGHASTPRGANGRPPSAPERLAELLARVPAEPLDVRHPALGSSTLAVSGVGSAETPYNVLAGRAWARLDARFPAPATPDEVHKAVERALGHPEDAAVALVKEEPAFQVDPELGAVVVAALQERGLPSEAIGVHYASEAGHWSRAAPTVVCGPGSIDRAHKGDEYIMVNELEQGVVAYLALLEAV